MYRQLDPLILRNYLKASGLSFRENSISYIFTCPRCSKKDKLYIRKKDGCFVCWVCKETDNYKGRCEYALAELLGISVQDVASELYGAGWAPASLQINVDLGDWYEDTRSTSEGSEAILERVEWPWNFYTLDDPKSKRGVVYLAEKRGVPLSVAMRYDIRYCPELRQIIFPIQKDGKLYGWQGRVTYEHKWIDEQGVHHEVPKSPTSKGLKSEQFLMFMDRAQPSDHLVVCEGPVDGLKAHLCGGNVVTCGKGVSNNQLKLLKNSGKKKIYLALDDDAATDVDRCVRELSDLEVYHMVPPKPYHDLGEMSFEEVYETFKSARRVNAGNLFVFLKPIR